MAYITIAQAIAEANELERNEFSAEAMTRWLSRLDGVAFEKVISLREGGPESFEGYPPDADPQTPLLIPEPHGEVYTSYLLAQIARHQEENDLYNERMLTHQDAWDAWAANYAQGHRQRLGGRIRF